MKLTFLAAMGALIVGGSAIGCSIDGPGEDDGSDGGSESGSTGSGSGSGSTGSGSGSGSTGSGSDVNSDNDACGLTDDQEIAMGSDPNKLDSDDDGFDDCAELECVSDPANPAEKCYACGWKHNDPGNLSSDGNGVGNTVANVSVVDQCGEMVGLWDLAGEYHILWRTDAW